jgi:hypothetical protein
VAKEYYMHYGAVRMKSLTVYNLIYANKKTGKKRVMDTQEPITHLKHKSPQAQSKALHPFPSTICPLFIYLFIHLFCCTGT